MIQDDDHAAGLIGVDEVDSEDESWEDEAEDEDFGMLPRRP
jgi:hypothetical protein